MRKSLLVLAGAAGLAAAAGNAVAATTTTTFAVTATVNANCLVAANALNFATYAPGGGDLDVNTTLTVRCTKNTAYTVALNAGSTVGGALSQRLMGNGSDTLQYNLFTTAARDTIWGDGTSSTATVPARARDRACRTPSRIPCTAARRQRREPGGVGRQLLGHRYRDGHVLNAGPVRCRYQSCRGSCPVPRCVAVRLRCLRRPPRPPQARSAFHPSAWELSSRSRTQVLTVRNEEDRPVVAVAHARVVAGRRPGSPRGDARPAGHAATVHAAGAWPAGGAHRYAPCPQPGRELDYRLLIEEVPQAAAADFTGLQVALRLSLPVFVQPEPAAAAHWAGARPGSRTAGCSCVHNTGNAHVQVLDFDVQPVGADQPVLQTPPPATCCRAAGRSGRWSRRARCGPLLCAAAAWRLGSGDFTAEVSAASP
jgi:spore coat protein U-like protein